MIVWNMYHNTIAVDCFLRNDMYLIIHMQSFLALIAMFLLQIKKCEVEKRRRERIEISLEHMKTLVLNAYGKNVSILDVSFIVLN